MSHRPSMDALATLVTPTLTALVEYYRRHEQIELWAPAPLEP
jgi:hypothetical protein